MRGFLSPLLSLTTESSPHFESSYYMLNWVFKSRQLVEMEDIVQCFSVSTVPQNHLKDLLKRLLGPRLKDYALVVLID